MSRKKRYISKFFGIKPDDYIGMYNRVRQGYFWHEGKRIEVKTLPAGFWNKEVAILLIRYYVLEVMKLSREEYLEKANLKFFNEGGLRTATREFRASVNELTQNCFPEWEINPWELRVCPANFLNNKHNCKRIMQWICVKECIHRDKKKFCNTMSIELFEKYGLGKAVKKMGGLYNYVNYVYPGKYKPWELKIYRITDNIAKQAVKWLIEEKLKWSKEEVCKNICANTFRDYGLESILIHKFSNSPIKALDFVYPGEYTKEMLAKWVKVQKRAVL